MTIIALTGGYGVTIILRWILAGIPKENGNTKFLMQKGGTEFGKSYGFVRICNNT